mgnify:CR=1 FL=1|tara:strand:- start:195 stop:488 length:294 start_codon:yes stop_codon:yes gene_type:complete
MIIDIVKEAFDEGREFGGEWEDSDAYEISKLLPFLDIENLTFQQRLPNGQFGKVFKGVNEVKKYVVNELNLKFIKGNFETAVCAHTKYVDCYWEVII